jgi:hypothetical protein
MRFQVMKAIVVGVAVCIGTLAAAQINIWLGFAVWAAYFLLILGYRWKDL